LNHTDSSHQAIAFFPPLFLSNLFLLFAVENVLWFSLAPFDFPSRFFFHIWSFANFKDAPWHVS
jgi:hypothetical protein